MPCSPFVSSTSPSCRPLARSLTRRSRSAGEKCPGGWALSTASRSSAAQAPSSAASRAAMTVRPSWFRNVLLKGCIVGVSPSTDDHRSVLEALHDYVTHGIQPKLDVLLVAQGAGRHPYGHGLRFQSPGGLNLGLLEPRGQGVTLVAPGGQRTLLQRPEHLLLRAELDLRDIAQPLLAEDAAAVLFGQFLPNLRPGQPLHLLPASLFVLLVRLLDGLAQGLGGLGV